MTQHRYTAMTIGQFWGDYLHSIDHWDWSSPKLDAFLKQHPALEEHAIDLLEAAFDDFQDQLLNRDREGRFGP